MTEIKISINVKTKNTKCMTLINVTHNIINAKVT